MLVPRPAPGRAAPSPTSRRPGEQRLGNFPPTTTAADDDDDSGKRGRLLWLPSQKQGVGRPASLPQRLPPSAPSLREPAPAEERPGGGGRAAAVPPGRGGAARPGVGRGQGPTPGWPSKERGTGRISLRGRRGAENRRFAQMDAFPIVPAPSWSETKPHVGAMSSRPPCLWCHGRRAPASPRSGSGGRGQPVRPPRQARRGGGLVLAAGLGVEAMTRLVLHRCLACS